MPEAEWDGMDASDTSPKYRRLSDLGPTDVKFSPVGPVNANSRRIRDYIRIMRTRYISIWQLGALAGGMQALLFLASPYSQQAKDTMTALLFEQVQYWQRSLRESVAHCSAALLAHLACPRKYSFVRPFDMQGADAAGEWRVPGAQASPHARLP